MKLVVIPNAFKEKVAWADTALPASTVLTVNHAAMANAKEVLTASVNPVPPTTTVGRLKENNAAKASVPEAVASAKAA